jgi:hypothetical protein
MVDKKLFDIFIRIILCLQKILEKEGLPKTKIIITGDFFQLPPAVDKPDYAFESAY